MFFVIFGQIFNKSSDQAECLVLILAHFLRILYVFILHSFPHFLAGLILILSLFLSAFPFFCLYYLLLFVLLANLNINFVIPTFHPPHSHFGNVGNDLNFPNSYPYFSFLVAKLLSFLLLIPFIFPIHS